MTHCPLEDTLIPTQTNSHTLPHISLGQVTIPRELHTILSTGVALCSNGCIITVRCRGALSVLAYGLISILMYNNKIHL